MLRLNKQTEINDQQNPFLEKSNVYKFRNM